MIIERRRNYKIVASESTRDAQYSCSEARDSYVRGKLMTATIASRQIRQSARNIVDPESVAWKSSCEPEKCTLDRRGDFLPARFTRERMDKRPNLPAIYHASFVSVSRRWEITLLSIPWQYARSADSTTWKHFINEPKILGETRDEEFTA